MRQLVQTLFISNNHVSFQLWWKEKLVKYQKVSKYYEDDCRALFCMIQSALSFCVTHPVLCSTRLRPCFWILVLFHTQSMYYYFAFLSAVSPVISRCVFLFEILRIFWEFSRFFEILRDFRYFSFLFLSSRVRNYICILWNPNIYFNNNNNCKKACVLDIWQNS